MAPVFVACVWMMAGALVGVAESFLIARGHGYYFNTLGSLLLFLFLPAAAYAVAGILVGALLWAVAFVSTRSSRRALVWSASLCLPLLIVLFWGSALDGRFFGTLGNALGHIGMVAAAVVSFLLVRPIIDRERQRTLRPFGVAATVLVVLAAIAAVTLPVGRPLTAGSPMAGNPTAAGAADRAPNVLLVTIDTLRADRTGYSGYRPPWQPGGDRLGTTPRLDGLAASGTVFADAIVPEVVTDPSHASLLTAVPPWEHGVWRNAMPLRLDVPVAAEAFADAGYATAAFVSVEHLDGHISRLSRGFSSYSDCGWEDRYKRHVGGKLLARHIGSLFAHERDAREVCAAASEWLESRATSEAPFFLWVHVFDPHMPYVNHETGRVFSMEERADYAAAAGADPEGGLDHGDAGDVDGEAGASIEGTGAGDGLEVSPAVTASAAYDSEVRFADSGLGLLLDALEQAGLVDETLICVTSDHGEHMNETRVPPESWFAHVDVFDEVCRVPLVFAGPGAPTGRVVSRQVSTMDVASTLLQLAGVEGRVGGREGLAADLRQADERTGASEPLVTLANPHRDLDHRAVRDGSWKLIERGGLPDALYDLAEDPAETVNIIQSNSDQVVRLGAILSETPVPEGFSARESAPTELDPATREMLEALGYIQ